MLKLWPSCTEPYSSVMQRYSGSVANVVENDEAAGHLRGWASPMRAYQVGWTPLFDKEGWGEIFPLPIEGIVRTWTRFKSPLPPFTKGGLAESLLTIDSTEIDQGGLTPPKLRLIRSLYHEKVINLVLLARIDSNLWTHWGRIWQVWCSNRNRLTPH